MSKLTKAQRELLALAERAKYHNGGNPWPYIGMQARGGGAKMRMFTAMKADGLFDANNCITEAGRLALSKEGEAS